MNMPNFRDRRTRYKHYARLWAFMLAVNVVLVWAANNWMSLLWYFVVTPPLIAIWEAGERRRDREWELMRLHPPPRDDQP